MLMVWNLIWWQINRDKLSPLTRQQSQIAKISIDNGALASGDLQQKLPVTCQLAVILCDKITLCRVQFNF